MFITKSGKLVWRDEFAKCGIAMDDSSSQARAEQAKKLYAYAKKHDIPGVIYITDKKGCIEINDLAEGIYLIAQTEEVEEGRDGFMSDPFWVMIPTEENGETEWDVDIEPKADWVSHDGEPVYPGDKPKDDSKDDSKDNPKDPITDNTTDNSKDESVNDVKKREDNPAEKAKKKDIRERIFGFGRTKTDDLSIVDIWFTILMVSIGMITIIVTVRKRK